VSASQAKVGVEKNRPEGHMLEVVPSQKKTPWRRVRPRKNKEIGGEGHLPTEMSAHSVAKEFTMHTTWLEPVGTTIQGSRR
jgi:hypothetical protein